MNTARQVGFGILVGLVSVLLLLGGLSLAMVEGGLPIAQAPSPSATLKPPVALTAVKATASQTFTPSLPPLPASATSTVLPSQPTTEQVQVASDTAPASTPTASLTPMPTATHPPTSTGCPPPAGWSPYIVQAGDTLDSLAETYNTTPEELALANCVDANVQLRPGTVIYVPGLPPTQPPIPCGPPYGWVFYTVQPGDTLYHLSQMFGVSVAQLQQANCMGSSTLIKPGQKLYVPYVPTRTPTRGPTRTPAPTRTPVPPTDTPLPSDTPVPHDTPTPQPTTGPTETEEPPIIITKQPD